MIRPAIRRAVRGAMRFAMNSNTPRYEQIATGNVVRAMADRVYLDASASGTSDIYNNTHQLAITGGTGSGQSSLVNDYVVDNVTNLLTYSEQFDNAAWTKINLSITPDSIVSPDGTITADLATITTVNHFLRFIVSSVTELTDYTFSFYVKRGTATDLSYSVYDATAGADIISPTSYYADTSLTGWVRISVPFTTPAGCLSINVYPLRDGVELGTCYLWGAQLNIGSTVQEYVPTIATTVTETVRVAHVSSDFTTIPQGPADSTYAVNKILGVP